MARITDADARAMVKDLALEHAIAVYDKQTDETLSPEHLEELISLLVGVGVTPSNAADWEAYYVREYRAAVRAYREEASWPRD